MQVFVRYTIINFFVFIWNILSAPFSKLARHRLSNAYQMLTYPYFGDYSIELSSILKNENLQLTIAPLKARLHNVTEFELLSICALLKDNMVSTVFEIGTFDGRSTRAMAMNLLPGGEIFTLNLPPETNESILNTSMVDIILASKVTSGERFLNTKEAGSIKQLWGDSATFNFEAYYGKMDMVFIDGAHSHEYVASDTRCALKLIRESGGIIVWHDAHLYGVVKFLKKWIQTNKYPVYFIKGTSVAVLYVKDGLPIDLKSMSV